jgi:nucleotide-binding universal stress UspA family protein
MALLKPSCRDAEKKMISTILLARDGSEAAAAAERYALALASRTNARLMGLSVVEARLVRGYK